MSDEFDQNKTEEATPRRLERARDEGDVVFSPDLSGGIVLLAISVALWLFSSLVLQTFTGPFFESLPHLRRMDWTVATTNVLAQWFLSHFGVMTAVVGGIAMTAAIFSTQLQSGMTMTWQPLSPKWDRLSPTNGWNRLFSPESALRGGLSVLKLASTVAVVLLILRSFTSRWRENPFTSGASLSTGVFVPMLFGLAFITFSWGLVDYAFRWWRHQQKLKMSRQEIQDEQKDDQGDPQIRARMRRIQKETAMQRKALQEVPNATMVITNPTHYAVALRYESGKMNAPVVVAKGTDAVARRIAETARKHGIPVLERKPLTRAIFALADVGDEIPAEFYRAIAELLAHVYRLKNAS
ncbi:MAG: EscU/YscU/HrcU family type III secretion system export apparatus switch protein [Planctomycetaceae bacterium]|nr:EscU/YscU/HrcU family type III secretion system export apparatus switch protein [Planctomycetaceae bacterium]